MESHMASLDELDLGEDDRDFELRLRAMCGLFLSIHRKKVYFLHQTAREFLLAKSPPLAVTPYTWRHSISELQAHSQLVRVCVQYIYLLDPDVVHNPRFHNPCPYCATPFLAYSRSYWHYHIRHGDLDDDVGFLTTAAAICEPGSKHLRTWTERTRGWEGLFYTATTASTSLHYPAALGCNPLVHHIIRTMGDEEFKAAHNTTTSTPLTLAARYGYPDTVKLLIEAGAKVDAGTKVGAHFTNRTPLNQAVLHGKLECAITLLDYGASFDHVLDSDSRETLLHVACMYGSEEMVKLLVKRGINVNSTNSDGDTPLITASSVPGDLRKSDGLKIARVLVGKGANLDIANEEGQTALMKAIRNHKWDLARFFVEQGADPNLQSCKGDLALHIVRYDLDEWGRVESLARALVEKFVLLEAPNHQGLTPL
ncbi:ankyrin repeat-containing domain protein [Pseudoneurospora amorphoporcata]|uniref:Ankyrin repeat-containing domain protein n=1 Tax=Pseudoneurospora amorphoporcata TaxID=241081 RepID=A0AAN6SBN9_9PEZI|nr:ankyrin repeat-containing domain protein [Pseudoneurospora amorphoporcata]